VYHILAIHLGLPWLLYTVYSYQCIAAG